MLYVLGFFFGTPLQGGANNFRTPLSKSLKPPLFQMYLSHLYFIFYHTKRPTFYDIFHFLLYIIHKFFKTIISIFYKKYQMLLVLYNIPFNAI